MSQSYKISSYQAAIESFEYVQSLLNNGVVNLTQIQDELLVCSQRLELLTSEETSNVNSPFLTHLYQLKELVLELIKILQKKITKQVTSLPKMPSKMNQGKGSVDKVQNIIETTIEQPRVSGLKEIAGLWHVKKLLKSLVILPKNQPQLFVNHKAYNSILLFGPPGTGKTHLVHALASETKAILHSVSVSALLSPLVGQTEKNVQALFEHVINSESFSILFIDEVDGFCRTRHNSEQDHTRRMKTELMCQMSKVENIRNTFLICATNCPWDLDTAFLRRFQRRIYIPLPNITERHDLLQLFTKNTPLNTYSEQWDTIASRTEGFSGSDLSDLVQSTLNIPIMELEETKIWKTTVDGFYEPVILAEDFDLDDIICCDLDMLPYNSVRARPVQIFDLLNSLSDISATVPIADQRRYEEFINIKQKF